MDPDGQASLGSPSNAELKNRRVPVSSPLPQTMEQGWGIDTIVEQCLERDRYVPCTSSARLPGDVWIPVWEAKTMSRYEVVTAWKSLGCRSVSRGHFHTLLDTYLRQERLPYDT